MRFTRLFSAITLVAAVTVLGSCGQSSAPTTASTTDPSLALGPREFSIDPNPVSWSKLPADLIPTDTRTVLISGVIALASYPQFGTAVYTGGGSDWLDINTAPNFSLNPLGWKVTFKLRQSAQALPIGNYTATIPVMVPAALNNPQNIVVTFSNCGNCVFAGSTVTGALTGSSPTFGGRNNSSFFSAGGFPYQDYRLIVEAGQTVWVHMLGSCSGFGTHTDPYQFVYTVPANALVTSDDDGFGCVFDSKLSVTNGGATRQEYILRETSFSSGQTGTYTLLVRDHSISPGGPYTLRMNDETVQKLIADKAALKAAENH